MSNVNKIGIDIDNTLTKLDVVLEAMSEYYNKPLARVDDVLDYNLSGVYDIPEEEAINFWKENESWICTESNMCPVVSKVIKDNFINEYSEVHIITARDEKYRKETVEWLKENGIEYDSLIMTGGESKKNIINNLGLDVMIDDKPELFYEMKDSQTTMVCVDYGYNKDVPCDIRITREGEVIEYWS